jgi:hypothetical protein
MKKLSVPNPRLLFDAYNEPINNWIIIDVFMMGNIDE